MGAIARRSRRIDNRAYNRTCNNIVTLECMVLLSACPLSGVELRNKSRDFL